MNNKSIAKKKEIRKVRRKWKGNQKEKDKEVLTSQ